ncbi:hypothetical protein [Streptomyces sp. NPDC005423]|uniref:hypothetical protein n=1 Tax=Streptomyces sp. NPDC005423 TaxID=3155343 RepID=UPI0033A5635B
MISTRRIAAAVGFAVGVTGLAAPMASAAAAAPQDTGKIHPLAMIDALATSEVPADHAARLPKISQQLAGLSHLNDLNQLHQLTDLAAPVTGLLPAVQY